MYGEKESVGSHNTYIGVGVMHTVAIVVSSIAAAIIVRGRTLTSTEKSWKEATHHSQPNSSKGKARRSKEQEEEVAE